MVNLAEARQVSLNNKFLRTGPAKRFGVAMLALTDYLTYACPMTRRELFRSVIVVVLIFQVGGSAGQQSRAQSTGTSIQPKDIAKRAFPSVVMVLVDDKKGQPLAIGSGFFIAPGLVATNLHVIEGAGSAKIRLIGRKDILRVTGTAGIDARHDLALLATEEKRAPILGLAKATPEIGEEVYAIGNPRGLEGTFSAGIVSAVRQSGSDTLLQITAPISPGSSGGPVLNARSEVVGVAVATLKGGQNLNFAIPASVLQVLVANATDPKPLKDDRGRERSQAKSVVTEFGNDIRQGVTVNTFEWEGDWDFESGFTVSFKNATGMQIKDIVVLMIFYDTRGEPLDTTSLAYFGNIGPGLAKRVNGHVDKSVKRLTTREVSYLKFARCPVTKVEYRVLNYSPEE